VADWSQAISNSVSCYGIDRPDFLNGNQWGVIVWGVDAWGYQVIPVVVLVDSVQAESQAVTGVTLYGRTDSVVSESETPTDDETFQVQSVYSETESMTDLPCVAVDTGYGETETPTAGNGSEMLQDGKGYFYNFTDPTENAENRALTSFACGSVVGNAWSSAAAGTTTWS